MKNLLPKAMALVALAVTSAYTSAAVITVLNEDAANGAPKIKPINLADGAVFPVASAPTPTIGKLGTGGYKLYSVMTEATATTGFKSSSQDLNSLPSYVSSITGGGSRYLDVNNNDLTIGGTLYTTGYINARASSNYVVVTLGAGVPSEFQFGLLLDNHQETERAYRPVITLLTADINDTNPSVAVTDWEYFTKAPRFLVMSITGAVAGDQIRVDVQRLGGLTFDVVPEPSSIAVLGLLSLGMHRHRR